MVRSAALAFLLLASCGDPGFSEGDAKAEDTARDAAEDVLAQHSIEDRLGALETKLVEQDSQISELDSELSSAQAETAAAQSEISSLRAELGR